MNKSQPFHRRHFFKLASCIALSAPIASCATSPKRWHFFTPEETRIAEAFIDRLIPADEDPGALQAEVIHFLDRKLAGFYAFNQTLYRQGLAAVETTSEHLYQKPFSDLTPDQKDGLLQKIEQGDLPEGLWIDISPQEFFRTILDHTMQGFYGSPRHGGNKDFCSWRMLGIPHPPLRGRMQYDKSKQETLFG